MPEVVIPRLTGKAMYATRVVLPEHAAMCKMLASPHPRAMVKTIDASKAEKMPGVAYILTPENAPKTYPMPEELFFQGEVVAIVAAETEDQAEDAVAAIEVEYEVLPFAASLEQAMAPNPPDLSNRVRRPNVVKTAYRMGRCGKAFAQADVVKEFTYFFEARSPSVSADWLRGQVGWRQADDLGHGSELFHPQRATHLPGSMGDPCREYSLHQQMEWRNIWRSDAAGAEVLSLDRLHPKRPAGR